MKFFSVNKEGVPAHELIAKGVKTVTRRSKPKKVGSIHEVYSPKGIVKSLRIRVTSCQTHEEWNRDNFVFGFRRQEEAEREGFGTWKELIEWFKTHNFNIHQTYRIGFEVVKRNEQIRKSN